MTDIQIDSESEIKRNVVAFAEQKYFESGVPPRLNEIVTHFEQQGTDIVPYLLEIKQQLDQLGMSKDTLHPQAFILAQTLLSTSDRRSLRVKLKEAGLTMRQYEILKRNPKFLEYMRKEATRRFGDADIEADLQLVKNIEEGDLRAIQYYNEMTGRARSPEAVNVMKVLATVMEILVQHVDPETLRIIATQLEEKVFTPGTLRPQVIAAEITAGPEEPSPVEKKITLQFGA